MSSNNVTLCVLRPSSSESPGAAVVVSSPPPSSCPPNHVLLRVDRFGFSTNNITYQALGEHPHFRYFEFYPAPVDSDRLGIFPVWGFATVVESTHSSITAGERVYGFLAPTRYLLLPVDPASVNKHVFYVPRPHLPADRRPYNQLIRCAADPQYMPSTAAEDLIMLYRPLFWTAFWCEDWIFSSAYRAEATHLLISSASAKTAFCLAYCIRKRIARGETLTHLRLIGLTSPRNTLFTKELQLYDEVLEYPSFPCGPSFQNTQLNKRWIYVDVASNESLNERIVAHFVSSPDTLVTRIALGVTNLPAASPANSSLEWVQNNFPLAKPSRPSSGALLSDLPDLEHFFMPEWLAVRRRQLSTLGIVRLQNAAWAEFMRDCPGWVRLVTVRGAEALRRAYVEVVQNGLVPERGLIWSLWDDKERVDARL